MSTFMEKAKAKAAALRDKSKEALAAASEKIDDMSKPCVQCGSKAGVLRYDCPQCNTAKFCSKCTDYCSVTHAVVPVFTTSEKVVLMKESAAEKSAELYKKAVLKWKNRKNNKAGAGVEGSGGEAIDEASDQHAANPSGVQASIAAAAEDPNREKIDEYTTKSVCRLCFRSSVQTLDLSRNYDIVGPYDNDINATIIAVHGGGNSRGALRRMAEQLIQYKIRCILIDLPGHGGRMDEALSLESAIEAIHVASTDLMRQAVEKDAKAGLLLLMGVGLGGYVAMEYLGRCAPKKFDGAIIVNAGMGVGRDEASLLSRAALSLATSASQHLGARMITQAALRELKKVPTLMKEEVHQNLVDTGFYFHSTTDQLNTLKSVTTKASLSRFFGPVMFMDGSKDFHDMVDVYTKIAVDNELRTFRRGADVDGEGSLVDGNEADDTDTAEGGLIILSRSIQYPNGNHQFMHDARFADESYADVAVFVQQLVDRAALVAANPSLVLSAEEIEEVIRKQKEAADAAEAAAAAAAAEASKHSLFSKAKAMGAGLIARAGGNNTNNKDTHHSHATSSLNESDDGNYSNAATFGGCSQTWGDEGSKSGGGSVISSSTAGTVNGTQPTTRTSVTSSVAVPFSALENAKAKEEEEKESYTKEELQSPVLVGEEENVNEGAAAGSGDKEESLTPPSPTPTPVNGIVSNIDISVKEGEEGAGLAVEGEVAEAEEEEPSAASANSGGKKGKKGKKGGRN